MKTAATTPPPPDPFAETFDQPDPVAGETHATQALALYRHIARQPFFKGLSIHHLHRLAESAWEMKFEPGQTIFSEGSPANRFYLILTGKVVLEAEKPDRNVAPVQTLGPGHDLGWSWLFPPYSLTLSAHAVEPTETIFFYGTRLREQCEQDHELGYQLTKRAAEALNQCLKATRQRWMECMAANPDLAPASPPESVAPVDPPILRSIATDGPAPAGNPSTGTEGERL